MVIPYRKTISENNHKNLPQVSPKRKGGGAFDCADTAFRRMRTVTQIKTKGNNPMKNFKMYPTLQPSDFDCKGYEGRFLFQTRDGRPVVLAQHTDIDCAIWRVMFGTSSVSFGTYGEAIEYCQKRFLSKSGKPL
jgi:hypothetical protein